MALKSDQLVFDPMAGSGTTGASAVKNGFKTILCDKSEEYVSMMERRIGTELFTLKLFKQFTIIIALSFIGEVLHALIPFPIPASIYGILLLFLLLERRILQVDDVKEVSDFLIFIMPLLFVPAAVGLIDTWDELRASLTAYVTIIIAVTLIVMIATGLITQWFLRHSRKSVK